VRLNLETGFEQPLPSSEHIGQTESTAPCRHVPSSSRAVERSLEVFPSSYRLMGSAIPPRGSSTSRYSNDGREPYDRFVNPSSDFIPASEFHPIGRNAVLQHPLLSRGLVPLRRNPTWTSHHSRSCLLRVLLRPCRSCRLRRLAPVPISLACFIQARTWGSPFRALHDEDRIRLSARHPLLRLARRRSLRRRYAARRRAPPRVLAWLRRLSASAHGGLDADPPFGGSSVPDQRRHDVIVAAFRAWGPVRPRFRGFFPPSRWDVDSASLRPVFVPTLLGFGLPGALPFPALACSVIVSTVHLSVIGPRDNPGIAASTACLRTHPRLPRSASSPVLQAGPLSGSLPCTPEFQRAEKSADLFRGCRPLRGFHPRLPASPSRVSRGVSDRPPRCC
jgi:hypothetical protein